MRLEPSQNLKGHAHEALGTSVASQSIYLHSTRLQTWFRIPLSADSVSGDSPLDLLTQSQKRKWCFWKLSELG